METGNVRQHSPRGPPVLIMVRGMRGMGPSETERGSEFETGFASLWIDEGKTIGSDQRVIHVPNGMAVSP